MDTFFKFKEPKEIDVKGYLRKIRYFELDRAVNKRTEHILKMNGDGFNISIDKEKITKEEFLKIKDSIDKLNFS